ncbi:hypothetical protein AAG906_037014 [Vitis piasezkii]
MVRILSRGTSTASVLTRRELPSGMLLIDVLLRANIFPLQHKVQRRGAILEALFRISEGYYFGPHHLIMTSLLHFEEKRADTIPLLFQRLLCQILEYLGFPTEPRLECHHLCQERFTLDKWNQLAGYFAPPGVPSMVAPLVSPQPDLPSPYRLGSSALCIPFRHSPPPIMVSSNIWLRCVPIRTNRLLFSARFSSTWDSPIAPAEDTTPVEVRIPLPQDEPPIVIATLEDASSPPKAPTT